MKINFYRLLEPETGDNGGGSPSLDSNVEIPDYGALAMEDDSTDTSVDVETAEVSTDTTPAAEVVSSPSTVTPNPAPATAPGATTPAIPEAATQPPPASTPAPAQPAPQEVAQAPTASTEPSLLDTFEKHREAAIPQLAQQFQFTPEEVEALRVEPEKVLPTLAARVAFESMIMSYKAMQSQMQQVLPNMIQATIASQRANTEREDAFFSKWTELKKPEYRDVVLNSVKAFRAANPKATPEQVIQGAGLLASVSLGLPVPGVAPPAAAPGVGVSPQRPGGSPHRPTGVAGTAAPIAPTPGVPGGSDIDALIDEEWAVRHG